MDVSGRVRNGVVVLEGGAVLPEGVAVRVSYPAGPMVRHSATPRRVRLPLVPSTQPGSIRLTGERIAGILDDEDVSS
jgi:hypothetical protein